jgi:hypothetical protein
MDRVRAKNDLVASADDLSRLKTNRVRLDEDHVHSKEAVVRSTAVRVGSNDDLFRRFDDLLSLAEVVVRR